MTDAIRNAPEPSQDCPAVPEQLPWPAEDRPLLAFLPLIYVAWADGELTAEEIRDIRGRIEDGVPLDERSRERLGRWLDPDSPPPSRELQAMLRLIRRAGSQLDREARTSLAALGHELAELSAEEQADADAEADTAEHDLPAELARALDDLEDALGVVGREAARELMAEEPGEPPPPPELPPAAFDPRAMVTLLDGEHTELRQRLREILGRPEMALGHLTLEGALSVKDHREKVLAWARILADEGIGALAFPESCGGRDDLAAFIAAFETLAFHDGSLLVKFGVQFGLFGGSILQLGTERHHERYLGPVGRLELPGGFAMSEVGHGSNVRDVLTTATWDGGAGAEGNGAFVVHTPHPSARKQWIGNAAVHGRMVTVFAQLEVAGDDHGVHAFLVPIRDENGAVLPGVTIEDTGLKGGLNGVDNGLIAFDEVAIPRQNLLDRFASVSPDGVYESPIPGASRRFFTMLGTLVGGRISVASAGVSAAKVGIATAVHYGSRRRQFGPAGDPEMPILDYRSHQRRLMPLVAHAYAFSFALAKLREDFVATKEAGEDTREIETRAAGLKSLASRFGVDALQECREACGGQGYLAVNRIVGLRADADIYTTFEGDNTVLLQLVAKGVLTQFRRELGEVQVWGIVQHLAKRAAVELTEANPLAARRHDEDHLRDADFQRAAFRYRTDRLTWSAAGRLKARIDDGMDSFDAFGEVQDHLLALARAWSQQQVMDAFADAVDACERPDFQAQLASLRDLHALSWLEEDRGWYLKNGYFESAKVSAIRDLVNQLCAELREQAVHLVDGFGVPEALLPPIAFEDEAV